MKKTPIERLKASIDKVLGPDLSGGDPYVCRRCGARYSRVGLYEYRCETPGCMAPGLRLNIG